MTTFARNKAVQLSTVIALLIFVVYFRVISFDFVSWDDVIHVYQNRFFAPVDVHNLAHFWIKPYYSLYIPVSYTVFAILSVLAQTHGPSPSLTEFDTTLNPHVFHAFNLVLHTINSLLVFYIIRRAVKSDVPACFGALFFALHPLQVESVAWISELRGLLSSMFALTSVLLYQYGGDAGDKPINTKRTAAILCFALALLSKPDAVMVPVVLVVWETMLYGKPLRSTLIKLLPWFVLAATDAYITHTVQPVIQATVTPFRERPLIAIDSLGFYIEKLVWPFGLSTEYGRSPAYVLGRHCVTTTGAVLALVIFGGLVYGRNRRWVTASALTFTLFLLPVSGLVPFAYQFYSTVADRYVYLAMLGPALALAFLLDGVTLPSAKMAAQWAVAIVLCLLMVRSSFQVAIWRNTETLFANAIRVNPKEWLPHEQLGNNELLRKDYADAEAQYGFAIAQGPVDGKFWLDLGRAVQGQHRYIEAACDFTHSLLIHPNFAPALYYRAQCEVKAGEALPAISDYKRAVKLLPPDTYADNELAMELGSIGRYPEAVQEFIKTVQLHPHYLPAYYYLAMTYAKMGQPRLAQDVAKMALARDPNYAPVFPFVSIASVSPSH